MTVNFFPKLAVLALAATQVIAAFEQPLQFHPITAIPWESQLDFTPEAGAVHNGAAYLRAFTFTLDKTARIYIHGNFNNNWSPLPYIRDSEFDASLEGEFVEISCEESYNDDRKNWVIDYYYTTKPLNAGTYYLAFDDGNYGALVGRPYTTFIHISTNSDKPNMPIQAPQFYTISFNSEGGSNVPSQITSEWTRAVRPDSPTKSGYYFIGWYNDNEEWDFENNFVVRNVTLTAKWEATTSIRTPQIAANGLKAYTLGNSIILQNLPENAEAQVYSLSGKLVSSKSFNQVNQGSDMSVDVQAKGIYLVKVGKQTLRVTVR